MLFRSLLLSHVTLFDLLSNGGKFENPSVIKNTFDLFVMEAKCETSTTDLGGGMFGAIMFALFYYLFDAAGSQLIAFFLIIIGIILVTGKTLGDSAGKILLPVGVFVKEQWNSFVEDLKEWREKQQQEKIAQREARELTIQSSQSSPTQVSIPLNSERSEAATRSEERRVG